MIFLENLGKLLKSLIPKSEPTILFLYFFSHFPKESFFIIKKLIIHNELIYFKPDSEPLISDRIVLAKPNK